MSVPRGATLLAEETTVDDAWSCVASVWLSSTSVYGARVLVVARGAAAAHEGKDPTDLCSSPDAASVIAICEGVDDLSKLEAKLARGVEVPLRQQLPEGLLKSSIAKALLRARLTQAELA